MSATSLKGKTIFISGASRGIGLAIVRRCAADGANVAIVAKTAEPNPKLPGTIYSAADEIEAAGGKALPLQVDIRDEAQVVEAAWRTVETFGGIDIVINNASAINLTPTGETSMKRFDLMFGVNVRGTFLVTQACLPHLQQSAQAGRNPHVLTLAPPLNMQARWFAPHVAYTMAKYSWALTQVLITCRERNVKSKYDQSSRGGKSKQLHTIVRTQQKECKKREI